MPIYKHGQDVYDIPDGEIDGFEAQYPDATVEMYDGEDAYAIPVGYKKDFLAQYPGATYKRQSKPSAPSDEFTVTQEQLDAMPTGDGEEKSDLFRPKDMGTRSMLDMGYKPEDKFATALSKKTQGDMTRRRRQDYEMISGLAKGSNANTPESAARLRATLMEKTGMDPAIEVPGLFKDTNMPLDDDTHYANWLNLSEDEREAWLQKEQIHNLTNPGAETREMLEGIRRRADEGIAMLVENQPRIIQPQGAGTAIGAYYANALPTQTAKALTEAGTIIEAYRNHQNDENFFVGAAKGLKDGMLDIDNWTGVYMAGEMGSLYNIADKMEKGEALTQDEEDFLDAQAYRLAVEASLADDLGWGYKSGNTTGASIPFMLQMLASPVSGSTGAAINKGFAAVGKRALNKFGGTLLKNIVNKAVGTTAGRAVQSGLSRTVGGKALGHLIKRGVQGTANAWTAGTAQTLLFQPDRMAANIVDKKIGDRMVAERADAQFNTNLSPAASDGMGWLEAGIKGSAGTISENATEFFGGEFLEPFMKVMGDAVRPGVKAFLDGTQLEKFMKVVGESKAMRAIASMKAFNGPSAKFMKEVTGKAQWNGLFNEYLEEVVNGGVNVLTGDMEAEDWLSVKHNAETLLGLAWTSGAFGVLNAGARTRAFSRAARNVRQIDLAAQQYWAENPEQWEQFKASLEDVDSYEELLARQNSLVDELGRTSSDKEMNRQKAQTAMQYMQHYAHMMGMNAAEAQDGRSEAQTETETALGEGMMAETPEQQKDIVAELAAAQAQLEAATQGQDADTWLMQFGETPDMQLQGIRESGLDEQTVQDAETYIMSMQRYNGVTAVAEQEIEGKVKAARAEFDANVNADNGRVIQVHTKATKDMEDPVYVIKGNTDGGVITIRRTDGSMEQIPASDIVETLQDEDAAPLREAMMSGIEQEAVREVAARMQADHVITGAEMQMQAGQNVIVGGQQAVVTGMTPDGTYTVQTQEGKTMEASPQDVTDAASYNAVQERMQRAAQNVKHSITPQAQQSSVAAEEAPQKTEAEAIAEEFMDESLPLEERMAVLENNKAEAAQALAEAQAEMEAVQAQQPQAKDYRSIAELKAAKAQWQQQMSTAQSVVAEAQRQSDMWDVISASVAEQARTITKGNTLQTAASQPHGGISLYNKEVYHRHTTEKQPTETAGVSQDIEQSGTQMPSSMNTPTSSAGKDTQSVSTEQTDRKEISGKSAESNVEVTKAEAVEHNAKIDVKEIARQTGYKAKDIRRMIDFANRQGVKLNFANYTRTGGDTGAFTNAQAMAEKREITISKARMAEGLPLEWVMGHEMTHQVKADGNAENWEAYRQSIINAVGEDTFRRKVEETARTYRAAGAYQNMTVAEFNEAMEEEVCADMAGYLFLNPYNINKVMGVPESLVSRIWNWMKSVVGNDTPQSIKDAVKAWGELAEGKELTGQAAEGPRHSLVGTTGARALDKAEGTTVRMDNKDVAEEMEAAGKDAETIWLATGWERGTDGKWRYEVLEDFAYEEPRAKAERLQEEYQQVQNEKENVYRYLNRFPARGLTEQQKAIKKEQNARLKKLIRQGEQLQDEIIESRSDTTLGELIGTDNNIIRAYPELAGMPVSFVENSRFMDAGLKGAFDGEGIWINPTLENSAPTLLHEVQHAIQRIEGFARGGNTGSVKTKADAFREDVRPLHEMMLDTPEWAERKRLQNRWFDEKDAAEIAKIEQRVMEINESGVLDAIQSKRKQLQEKYGSDATVSKILGSPYTEDAEIWQQLPESFNDKYEAYRNLAGEAEARNVSARLNMSEEERRQTPPSKSEDVAREEQIVKKFSLVDYQGNPLNDDGTLKVEEIHDIDDLTEEDFYNAYRNVMLPPLPQEVNDAINAQGKRVVIKKNIFGKNLGSHKDLTAQDGRNILRQALYSPMLYGQNQKIKRPNNWILIHVAETNSAVVVEVAENKDAVEIINWHFLRGNSLEQKKRQAIKEGGLILTLNRAAGNTLNSLSSANKDTQSVSTEQTDRKEISGKSAESNVEVTKAEAVEHNAKIDVKEIARQTGYKAKDIRRMIDFANRQGVKLNFANYTRTGGDTGAFTNAQAMAENREITISKARMAEGLPLEWVMGHEMTHQVKADGNAENWEAYRQSIINAVGEDTFRRKVEETAKTYRAAGAYQNMTVAEFNEAMEEEVCADMAGYLFLNPYNINKVMGVPESLVSRIWNWMKSVVGNDTPQSIKDAVKAWGELAEGKELTGQTVEDPRHSIVGTTGARALDKAEGTTVRMNNKDVAEEMEAVIYAEVSDKAGAQLEETANATRYSIVVDPQLIAELEASPKRKGYRNVVQREDGLFEAPMGNSLRGNGMTVENTPFAMGQWEQSEEHPELVYGDNKITLVKPDGKTVADVNYNPYIHNRLNTLNAQFKQAWERPDLVYVETEVPVTDLEGGYMAEHAHLSTGVHQWSNGALMLSRYDKPVRTVPWDEVAIPWIEKYKKSGVHFDIVPPALRPILAEAGVKIKAPHKGMGKNCIKAYEEWKAEQEVRYSVTPEEPIGRSLAADETEILITDMKENADVTPELEFSIENWLSEFGKDGLVTTPIGKVKMGENQIAKLLNKNREKRFGLIRPTLQTPDVIIEKHAPAEGAERESKFLFIKTFVKPDGSRFIHFESVTVLKDGTDVSISSHEIGDKALKKEMQNGIILHLNSKLSSGSDKYLTKTPTERPDLVPAPDNRFNISPSLGGGVSPISHADDAAPAISLQSRNDDKLSASKDTQSVSTEQTDRKEISGKSAESNVEVTNEEVMHSISPIEGYTYSEVIDMVQNDVENILSEEGTDNVEAVEFWAHGSRMRGNAREDSDLDVVMFYKGNEKEDSLFNLINEHELSIDGIKVDVNPIRISNEQDIARYKEKSARYDQEMRFSLSAEEQSIIDTAKANGTYMKAPNGKPTNLNEKQWAQVRTKAFKEWFGDWEKALRIEKLRNSDNASIEGDEIPKDDDLKIYKKNALEYGKTLRNEYRNQDTGEVISLTAGNKRGGIREILQHDYKDEEHLQSIAAIPQIIEKSIFIEERPNEDRENYPNVESFRYYVCGLKIGNMDYTVKSVVAVQNNGDRYYDHKLTNIEKGKLLSIIPTIQKAGIEGNLPLSAYKDKRLISILQANTSKIVDENGEPRVMYHGSSWRPLQEEEGNAVFKMQDGALGEGAYFTSSFPEAADYVRDKLDNWDMSEDEIDEGGYVTEVFLNIRDDKQILRDNAYGNDSFVAATTSPTQIKSATDNVGSFDAENADIRYSINTYHGSGAAFDKFDHAFMGSGEGAQAFGWGTYVSEVEGIAKRYAEEMRNKAVSEKHRENAVINSLATQTLQSFNNDRTQALKYLRSLLDEKWSDKKRVRGQIKIIETGRFLPETKAKAHLYTVDIPDDNGSNYLIWDGIVPDDVIDNIWEELRNTYGEDIAMKASPKYGHTGMQLYRKLENATGSDKEASQFLGSLGFVGIKYPAQSTTGGRKDNAQNYVIFNESDAQIVDHRKFSITPDTLAANERFNEELDEFKAKTHKGLLHLGKPGAILRTIGVDADEMTLSPSVLSRHLKKHNLTADDLIGLPLSVQTPILAYRHGDKNPNLVVVTEMDVKGGKLSVSLEIDENGHVVEIDNIRSVHSKDATKEMARLGAMREGELEKALRWVEKEEVQDWLGIADLNRPIHTINPELSSVANVLLSFQNPPIIEDESSQNDANATPGVQFSLPPVAPRGEEESIMDYAQRVAKAWEKQRKYDTREPRETLAREQYEERVASGWYKTQEALQDSMLGLKAFMQAVTGDDTYIEDIAGYENAYIGENRLSSVNQAEATAMSRLVFDPMLEEVAKITRTQEERQELIDYMFAKHGLERNVVMAEREADAEIKNGSTESRDDLIAKHRNRDFAGLTALTGQKAVRLAEEEARKMVDEYEQAHDTEALWATVNEVNMTILGKLRDCGLLSPETYKDMAGMYDYYIPLRGFDEKTSDQVYAYLGHKDSPFNAPIKTAKGRRSKADDPFAQMLSMMESAIMQGNRNRLVKQRFLNFVQNHPSDLASISELWVKYDAIKKGWVPVVPTIDSNASPEEVEEQVRTFNEHMRQLADEHPKLYKRGREARAIPYRVLPAHLSEHQVVVKRGGVDYIITINGNPRAAQAVNGATNPDSSMGLFDPIFKMGEKVNRVMSAVYTSYNPDFVYSNFIRDMLYGNTMVWVKESPEYARRYNKNFFKYNPFLMGSLLRKWDKGTLNMDDKTEALFLEFMMNGGETGYANIRDIEDHKNDIRRTVERMNGHVTPGVAWDWLTTKLDFFSRSTELGARMAAFATSRSMGRGMDRAVYDAKEISVNFNKKGSGAKFMGAEGHPAVGNVAAFTSGYGRAFKLFWNAALQGTTNFGRQAKRHPAKALVAATVPFLLGMIVAGIAGDDDDNDKDAYFNIPENERRTNLMLRIGVWIKVPLPVEYRAMYGMGELMSTYMRGKVRMTDSELGEAMLVQALQMLPIDMLVVDDIWDATLPDWAASNKKIYENRSWTGLPIWKENEWNKDMPEWTKAYPRTDRTLVALAKALNEATGGDAYTKGVVDINPARVEALLDNNFGGISTLTKNMVKTGEMLYTSARHAMGDEEYEGREFNTREIPVIRRIVAQGDERTEFRQVKELYNRMEDEHNVLRARLKGYEQDTDKGTEDFSEELDRLYQSPEYKRYQIYEKYAPYVKALYEKMTGIQDKEERKKYEDSINEIKRKAVDESQSTWDMETSGRRLTPEEREAYRISDREEPEAYDQYATHTDIMEDIALRESVDALRPVYEGLKEAGDKDEYRSRHREELLRYSTLKRYRSVIGKHRKALGREGITPGGQQEHMDKIRELRKDALSL